MIEIKHRHTGAVLRTVDAADLRGAGLSGANLRWADLRWADLSAADLSGADLRGAGLRGADLSGVDLSGADLRGADLRWADLSGAELRGANLRGANLRGAGAFALLLDRYIVFGVPGVISIGCERHSREAWESFTDERIAAMDTGALDWWKRWKTVVLGAYDAAQADPEFLAAEEKRKQPENKEE